MGLRVGGVVPAAVPLDFGGVLVDVHHREAGVREVAAEVAGLVDGVCSAGLKRARIEADLAAGWRAYASWRQVQSRRPRPREIGHREFWEELVAADWPAEPRQVVAEQAARLCEMLDVATKDRPPREGALRLLRALADMQLPAGCISNALAGAGSRRLMREYGFEPLLGVQVYSDEVGMRKPHPGIFQVAAAGLGVDLAGCWYVGDMPDRDVLGGRRAGVGRVILMPSGETKTEAEVIAEPDEVVRGPLQLLKLIVQAVSREAR